jgi:hypothetical protein
LVAKVRAWVFGALAAFGITGRAWLNAEGLALGITNYGRRLLTLQFSRPQLIVFPNPISGRARSWNKERQI